MFHITLDKSLDGIVKNVYEIMPEIMEEFLLVPDWSWPCVTLSVGVAGAG